MKVGVVAHGVSAEGRDAVGVGGQFSVRLALDGVVDVLRLALTVRSWCECGYLWSSRVASSSVGAVGAAVVVFVVVARVVAVVIVVCNS